MNNLVQLTVFIPLWIFYIFFSFIWYMAEEEYRRYSFYHKVNMVEFSIPNYVSKVGFEVKIKSMHEVEELVPVQIY